MYPLPTPGRVDAAHIAAAVIERKADAVAVLHIAFAIGHTVQHEAAGHRAEGVGLVVADLEPRCGLGRRRERPPPPAGSGRTARYAASGRRAKTISGDLRHTSQSAGCLSELSRNLLLVLHLKPRASYPSGRRMRRFQRLERPHLPESLQVAPSMRLHVPLVCIVMTILVSVA